MNINWQISAAAKSSRLSSSPIPFLKEVKLRRLNIVRNVKIFVMNMQQVCSMMQKMWDELGDHSEEEHSQIDRLLIFDRSADLVTPLVTQLTYEGLIDEAYGINNSKYIDMSL